MLFLVSFGFGTVLFFGAFADSPVLLDGGHHREVVRFVKMLRYPLVSCRYLCIFCKRMHLQYIEAFLVSTLWGFAPNPSLTCGAAGAGG